MNAGPCRRLPPENSGTDSNGMDQIKEIEAKIVDLKSRWPAHSVPPNMWQELEDLENDLEKAKEIKENKGS